MRRTLAAAALAAGLAIAGCGGSAPAVSHPAQPESVQAVAAQLHATGLTDCGPAPGGGVTDSATAYLGTERIGIDTFPNATVRDQWKKTAASFGVVPFAQSATWVAYKSTAQSAHGCN